MSPDDHHQCIPRQLTWECRFHRLVDHVTSEEIDNHRQIQPALPGADISNVSDPDLIGPDFGELPLQTIRGNSSNWKCDGNGSYISRVLLLNGDIYNLYLIDQGYKQLVARGFRKGVNVLVKDGKVKDYWCHPVNIIKMMSLLIED